MGVTDRKNVIIIGAGASKEFGLPIGAELTSSIAALSHIEFGTFGKVESGNYKFVDTLRDLAERETPGNRNINRFLGPAQQILENMPLAPSIDNFLDTHKDNKYLVEYGKLAITHEILAAEKRSDLFVDRSRSDAKLSFSAIKDTWIGKLFSIMVAQRDFENFKEAMRNITFISFNYDRCIVHFFANAAQSYFSLSEEQVEDLLNSISIIHPYGNVGDYKWRNRNTNFGRELYGSELIDVATNIRTFTQGVDDAKSNSIFEVFLEAEIIVFLGFGYLPLNMTLLNGGVVHSERQVIGTGKGLSKNSIATIKSQLFENFFDTDMHMYAGEDLIPVEVLDVTCAELIHEYERLLMG